MGHISYLKEGGKDRMDIILKAIEEKFGKVYNEDFKKELEGTTKRMEEKYEVFDIRELEYYYLKCIEEADRFENIRFSYDGDSWKQERLNENLGNGVYTRKKELSENQKELILAVMEFFDSEFEKYEENIYGMSKEDKLNLFMKDNPDLSNIGIAYTTRDFDINGKEVNDVEYQVVLDIENEEIRYYLNQEFAKSEKIEEKNYSVYISDFRNTSFDDWLIDIDREAEKILTKDSKKDKPKKKKSRDKEIKR